MESKSYSFRELLSRCKNSNYMHEFVLYFKLCAVGTLFRKGRKNLIREFTIGRLSIQRNLPLTTFAPFFHKVVKDIIQSLDYTFIYRNLFIKKLHTSFPHKVHTKYQTIEYSCSMSTPHPLKYQSLISFVVS